jgi:hypothetical protein
MTIDTSLWNSFSLLTFLIQTRLLLFILFLFWIRACQYWSPLVLRSPYWFGTSRLAKRLQFKLFSRLGLSFWQIVPGLDDYCAVLLTEVTDIQLTFLGQNNSRYSSRGVEVPVWSGHLIFQIFEMSPKTHWHWFQTAVVLFCSHPLYLDSTGCLRIFFRCTMKSWYNSRGPSVLWTFEISFIWNVSQNTLRISVCPWKYKFLIHKCLQNTLRMSVCYGDNYVFELCISKNTLTFSVCFGDIWKIIFRNVSQNTLRDNIDQCVKCVECVMENFPMLAFRKSQCCLASTNCLKEFWPRNMVVAI